MAKIFKLRVDDDDSITQEVPLSLMIPDSLLPQLQNVNPFPLTNSLQVARAGFHKQATRKCAKVELKLQLTLVLKYISWNLVYLHLFFVNIIIYKLVALSVRAVPVFTVSAKWKNFLDS